MFCTQCGKELQAEGKFCPYCGSPLPQASEPIPSASLVQPESAKMTDSRQSGHFESLEEPKKKPNDPNKDAAVKSPNKKISTKEIVLGLLFLLGSLMLVGMPQLLSLLFPTDVTRIASLEPTMIAAVAVLNNLFAFFYSLILYPLAFLSLAAPAALWIRGEGGSRGVMVSSIAQIAAGLLQLLMAVILLLFPEAPAVMLNPGLNSEVLSILRQVFWAGFVFRWVFLLLMGFICLALGAVGLVLGQKGLHAGKLPRAVGATVTGGAVLAVIFAFFSLWESIALGQLFGDRYISAYSLVQSFWSSGFATGMRRLPLIFLIFLIVAVLLLTRKVKLPLVALIGGGVVLLGSVLLHIAGYAIARDGVAGAISSEIAGWYVQLFVADSIAYCVQAVAMFLWALASSRGKYPLWLQIPLHCILAFVSYPLMLVFDTPTLFPRLVLGVLMILPACVVWLIFREKKA